MYVYPIQHGGNATHLHEPKHQQATRRPQCVQKRLCLTTTLPATYPCDIRLEKQMFNACIPYAAPPLCFHPLTLETVFPLLHDAYALQHHVLNAAPFSVLSHP